MYSFKILKNLEEQEEGRESREGWEKQKGRGGERESGRVDCSRQVSTMALIKI